MPITLATLAQATKQEIFDQVAVHLLKQNQRSTAKNQNDSWVCVYRAPNGLMCAAGCLIGKDEYDELVMEGRTWACMVRTKVVPEQHEEFISSLQVLHDGNHAEHWAEELIKFAAINNVKPTAALVFLEQHKDRSL